MELHIRSSRFRTLANSKYTITINNITIIKKSLKVAKW